jgi:hypothetical protein
MATAFVVEGFAGRAVSDMKAPLVCPHLSHPSHPSAPPPPSQVVPLLPHLVSYMQNPDSVLSARVARLMIMFADCGGRVVM